MVPVPRVQSSDELNAHLEARCRRRQERRPRDHVETIGERFERDRAALLALPTAPHEACEKVATWVSSLAQVGYRGNEYSVPTRHGHLQVLVRGTSTRRPSPTLGSPQWYGHESSPIVRNR
jgi:hypothetical protein